MRLRMLARRLTAVTVLGALGSFLLPLGTDAATSGFGPAGILKLPPREEIAGGTSAQGSLFIDNVHHRGYVFFKGAAAGDPGTALHFVAYDLTKQEEGAFKRLPSVKVFGESVQLLPGRSSPVQGDATRLEIDQGTTEPIVALDSQNGRILYVAGGAVYAIEALRSPTKLNKWVGPPQSAPTLSDRTLHFGPAQSLMPGKATGISYEFKPNFDSTPATAPRHRAYVVGNGGFEQLDKMAWLSGWDASPTPANVTDPQRRQLWLYETRTCLNLARKDFLSQTLVFRSGEWLYTFCDASVDESSRGVLRVHLAPLNIPGVGIELVPDGREEFFSGVTGTSIATYADEARERVYVLSTDSVGARNALVFDGRAAGGRGGYIGQISITKFGTAGAGVNPSTGRWYFQSKEGLWQQDGRLTRVAQGIRYERDTAGNSLSWVTPRPIRADDGVKPPWVFVEREGAYVAYQDLSPQPNEPLPPSERTLGVEESDKTVGVYSGVTSAYGLRVRAMRGLSTAWPSGIILNLESPPQQGSDFTLTDPFFYYAGDCGSKDREITFARVLQTELGGGLTDRSARASALAVDPEVHHKSSPDETQTREDVANPDPCLGRMYYAMTGQSLPGADQPGVNDNIWDYENLNGMTWPYKTVSCFGDSTQTSTDAADPMGVLQGTATATCKAGSAKDIVRSVTAESVARAAPDSFPSLVTVQSIRTLTSSKREIGKGLVSTSEARLRGVTIAGTVHIDEVVVRAVATAFGQAGKASRETVRQFYGLTVGNQTICAGLCDQMVVVQEINGALGAFGYARVSDPEPNYALGTTQGTLSVVQKNLLLQDADRTMNRDESSEWSALELVIYRDASKRGGGRWSIQLGGVFAQAQFGVIDAPYSGADEDISGFTTIGGDEVLYVDRPSTGGAGASLGVSQDSGGEGITAAIRKVLKQVLVGVGFALGSPSQAALMGALWALVCAPAYLALRRRSLADIIGSS